MRTNQAWMRQSIVGCCGSVAALPLPFSGLFYVYKTTCCPRKQPWVDKVFGTNLTFPPEEPKNLTKKIPIM